MIDFSTKKGFICDMDGVGDIAKVADSQKNKFKSNLVDLGGMYILLGEFTNLSKKVYYVGASCFA